LSADAATSIFVLIAVLVCMAMAMCWIEQGRRKQDDMWRTYRDRLDGALNNHRGRLLSIRNQTREAELEIERVANKIASAERHLQEAIERPQNEVALASGTQRAVSEALIVLGRAKDALDSAKKLVRGATEITEYMD